MDEHELDYDFETQFDKPIDDSEVLIGQAPGFDFLLGDNVEKKTVIKQATRVTNSPTAQMVIDFINFFPEVDLSKILEDPSKGKIMGMTDEQLGYVIEMLKKTVSSTADMMSVDEITRRLISTLYARFPKILVDHFVETNGLYTLVSFAYWRLKWMFPKINFTFSIVLFLLTTITKFFGSKGDINIQEATKEALKRMKEKNWSQEKLSPGLSEQIFFEPNLDNVVEDQDVFDDNDENLLEEEMEEGEIIIDCDNSNGDISIEGVFSDDESINIKEANPIIEDYDSMDADDDESTVELIYEE